MKSKKITITLSPAQYTRFADLAAAHADATPTNMAKYLIMVWTHDNTYPEREKSPDCAT